MSLQTPGASAGVTTSAPLSAMDGVLERMDHVLERCLRERSRLGYFAMLYRDVTARVRDAIARGAFDDGARMERLDVTFAARYLDALDLHWSGGTPTRSWQVAFSCAHQWSPVVLQHLLLGMNAHINLDLAIAAARTCPGAQLPALENDFRRITDLLGGMVDEVQQRMERISPWLRLVDRVGGRAEDRMIGFAIGAARDLAWTTATRLASLAPAEFDEEVDAHDLLVASLAGAIRSPSPLLAWTLYMVRLRELRPVPKVMDALRM
ncbi:MAG TPA: DUF5995 family protein [Longimicrobiales bacterium]